MTLNDLPKLPPMDEEQWEDSEEVPPQPKAEGDDHLSDVGNARRLVAVHGENLRYVPAWGSWLIWDGRRWRRDTKGEVIERAKAVARDLWGVAGREPTEDKRKQAFKWALASESANHIEAMVRMARSSPGIPVEPDELDRDPLLLNVTNGTVDLRTGMLREHRQTDLMTKMAAVAYNGSAQAPVWEAFLEQILPDVEVRTFVQEAVGYSLSGDVGEQVLLFCHGNGANGKTTLLATLQAMLDEYSRQAEPDLLLAREMAHPTGLADLQGARLVISSEIDEGRRLAEATVKQLTGGDRIKARFMRQDFFEFQPSHKLWIATNHRPVIRGTDHAIWRRIRLVPFTVTIPAEAQDRTLSLKLKDELSGVLTWAIQGCLRWQKQGLSEPSAVSIATQGYRSEMDLLGAFITEECIALEGAWVPASVLYAAYQSWAEGVGERPVSQRQVGLSLTERGFRREKRGAERRWHWVGLGLVRTGQGEPMNPSDPDSGMTAHTHAGAHTRARTREGDTGSWVQKGSWVQEEGPRLPYRDSD